MRLPLAVFAWLLASVSPAFASVFATVHGVVHDPQHRPVAGARILLKAVESDFSLASSTGSDGAFALANVPIGTYELEVNATGFAPVSQAMTLTSGTNAVVHIPLELAATTQNVIVHATDGAMAALDTATPSTLITREEIDATPGASRTLGMQMITDYVPGAYITHDMLHVRGGHQTSWLIDGVSIPNTKIDANVGPQIDPKDIDQLEVQRGSYSADVGGRTYGVFDVLPRNGFEYNHEGELMLTGGNFSTGEAQLSLGDHSAKTAWYASATGSRSDYGLQTPVAEVVHDATNSQSGFLSLIRNQTTRDQLRLNAQLRQDHFQVPYDPNADGLRDAQTERDSFVLANWVHTISSRAMVEVAPFWHWNQANYDSSPTDTPDSTTWDQSSQYAGMQADARADAGPNNFSAGLYSFAQWENDLFGLRVNDSSGDSVPSTHASATAGLVEAHLSDHLHLGRYVTLLGGLRISSYHAGLTENIVYPRVGATAEIPRLHWVLRGFYGRFFQPAPVITVSSALLNYIQGQPAGPNTITPLPSERDEEHQFGIQIPYRGWSLDVDTFRTRVNNYLDHANVGESNLYFPISIDGALVRAWEMTVRSPQIARRGQFHLAYSNQIAEQRGGITGGYTCSLPTDPACNADFEYEPLDHDQRHTLNTGFTANLPARTWFSANVYYGSGFVNGLQDSGIGPYQGAYLPAHTTFDVSAGHSFGERWKVSASMVNVTNHRVLLDNSVTIGGFHYNDPRMVTGELRYRFRF
jgi:TonB dependent receptor/Carboxypeptidase regulatory-like domain/TonB-dependent Receptor Plug Domain